MTDETVFDGHADVPLRASFMDQTKKGSGEVDTRSVKFAIVVSVFNKTARMVWGGGEDGRGHKQDENDVYIKPLEHEYEVLTGDELEESVQLYGLLKEGNREEFLTR